MADTTFIITFLGALVAVLFAVAPRLSETLVRARARRLTTRIALRMEEEWLGELNALASRPGKLAFAIALTLTRRQAFAATGEDSMTELHDRPVRGLTAFNGRKTLLILPTLIFAIAAYGASFLIPVRYASEALILVPPRDVPSSVVVDLFAGSVEERVKSIRETVLSRTIMIQLVHESASEGLPLDRTIEELRENITVLFTGGGHSGSVLRLRYVGPDPELAQKVTSKLTTSFIDQDNRMREKRVGRTKVFLQNQLKSLALRLIQKGDELTRVRAAQGPEAGRLLALDYDLLVSTYKTVFAKYEDVGMLEALESEQKGEGFVVVDSANLGTPVVPNRPAITGIGSFAGLVLGAMTVIGMDRRRQRALA